MIAKVTKGKSFAALSRYLQEGRDGGDNPHRVDWTEGRNIPTNDPKSAADLMQTTAAQSARVQKPVYHVALSFDSEDTVDRATMLRVADRLRSDLGIQEHQALIMAHNDTRHAHLHMVVNRVHPERSRAWDPKHDYAQIERSLRTQERELGLRAVRGRHYHLGGREQPDRAARQDRADTRGGQEAGARSSGAPSRNSGEEAESPRSPEPPRGNAPGRADADGRAGAAPPPRDPNPERRPPDRSAPGERREAAHRTEAIPAASKSTLNPRQQAVRQTLDQLNRRIQLERNRDTTRDELDRAHMRLLPHTGQRAEARQASAGFRSALAEVYRDPVGARRTFHARAEQVGMPTAAAEMARRPGRFGELNGTQVGPIRSGERTTALQAAPKLETLGTEHIRRVREAWSHRGEYRQERATVVHLERQLKMINHELGRSPGRAELEKRLQRQLRGLSRPQRLALHRTLPVPQQRVVAAAIRIARAFAHEQGHER